jgi:hypothetical protein
MVNKPTEEEIKRVLTDRGVMQAQRKSFGSEFAGLLQEGLKRGWELDKIFSSLKKGHFNVALANLQTFTKDLPYSANPFEDDPVKVAERLLGMPVAYINGIGSNIAGVVTKTAAFYEARGSCPELWEAEPGTIGVQVKKGGRPYKAILIASHLPNKSGVVSLEKVTVNNERWSKTTLTKNFQAEDESGRSLYRGNSRIRLAPTLDKCMEGFDRTEFEERGIIYFELRKER